MTSYGTGLKTKIFGFSNGKWMICFGIALAIFSKRVVAQDLNYTFSASSSAYTSLESPVNIASGAFWANKQFVVPIGFSFSFMGASFNELTVKPDGLISFDAENVRSFYCLKGITCKSDLSGNFSSMSYLLCGNSGSRILKIQLSNVGFEAVPSDNHVNLQVWLYEQGSKIEIRFGANGFYNARDSLYSSIVGLVYFQEGVVQKVFMLKGNPSEPATEVIESIGQMCFLTRIPSPGQVYLFTPNY